MTNKKTVEILGQRWTWGEREKQRAGENPGGFFCSLSHLFFSLLYKIK